MKKRRVTLCVPRLSLNSASYELIHSFFGNQFLAVITLILGHGFGFGFAALEQMPGAAGRSAGNPVVPALQVIGQSGAGGNKPTDNDIFLQPAQIVAQATHCRFGQHPGSFLEGCGGNERFRS